MTSAFYALRDWSSDKDSTIVKVEIHGRPIATWWKRFYAFKDLVEVGFFIDVQDLSVKETWFHCPYESKTVSSTPECSIYDLPRPPENLPTIRSWITEAYKLRRYPFGLRSEDTI